MFHRFTTDISAIGLPRQFNNPFHYRPHALCLLAADEVKRHLALRGEWNAEVSMGKMFGVLVVRSSSGEVGFLAAYSGLLDGSNTHSFFVPAVYDMLAPEGYFKREEATITQINHSIEALLAGDEYLDACRQLDACRADASAELSAMRHKMQDAKRMRDHLRASAKLTPEEQERLINESRFQKAELKRLAKRWQGQIAEHETSVAQITDRVDALKEERKQRSAALQKWLFTQFVMLNANGEQRTLLQIFEGYSGTLPPAGAGECAAPKLLQYAYAHAMHPLCIAEFWVGASPVGEVRRDGCFYGSCKGKCEPILDFMLRGLQVDKSPLENSGEHFFDIATVYEDDYLLVVDKPSGMLSVPGIVGGCSVQEYLRTKTHNDTLLVVHRLDMATSGLLVAAKNVEVFKAMQQLFALRKVKKRYVALLQEVPAVDSGEISLPLAPDYVNRPRQMVDFENGKEAVTRYNVTGVINYKGACYTRVELFPLTGRTHQLRVHCAHRLGLDCPIVGDELYGNAGERLMLHASSLSFTHPFTGEEIALESDFEF